AARLLVLAARSEAAPARPPAVVFTFPGQGAQYPAMGRALYRAHEVFRDHVEECLAALPAALAERLRTLVLGEPDAGAAALLRQTAHAQPALFMVEYALGRLLGSWGVTPAALVGHSVGEFVAAVLAGVMSPAVAVQLVAERGELMQQAPPGAMLAVRRP